jgi:transposase, IS5 family
MKRGQIKAMPEGPLKALHEWFERRKAQVRAIVEHPFHVVKNLFKYRKVSYRGIAKNELTGPRRRPRWPTCTSPGGD